MAHTVFLLTRDRRLVRLEETSYESEDLLQVLIEKHPDLLAGDQFGARASNWILVEREMGIGDAEQAGCRWSVDHLFIDQDAIPTLIEVKRSSDTRIRREVVGQLLEYAANGLRYWPVSTIQERFEARCEAEGTSPEQELAAFLGPEGDAESFWSRVGDNLRLGRLRLLFVADLIPRELQRIVEFLNEQMERTEVLAIEVRQYAGEAQEKTLVPRVIGQTAAAADVKEPRTPKRSKPWTPEAFIEKLREEGRDEDLPILSEILSWARRRKLSWAGGRGAYKASIWISLENETAPISIYEGTGRCVLHVQFNWMGPAFETPEARAPIVQAFNRIPGVELDPERPYPGIRFDLLGAPGSRRELFEALEATLVLVSEKQRTR